MGSAAFLNEAVNQLAEEYLTKKTKELGEVLDADRRQKELQRVKMYLADNNVYGVDLNPVAVELGRSQSGSTHWYREGLFRGLAINSSAATHLLVLGGECMRRAS